MKDCRFCEIIQNSKQNIDEEIIYENQYFIVVLNKYRKTSAGAICLTLPINHSTFDDYEELKIPFGFQTVSK